MSTKKKASDINVNLDAEPQILELNIKKHLSEEKISALLSTIQRENTSVIYITSTYSGEGADTLALETALGAAQSGDQKVLLIDMITSPKNPALKALQKESLVPLYGSSKQSPFIKIEGTSLYYGTCTRAQKIEGLLEQLRPKSDLIIIMSENALASQSIENYAHATDGGIIVVQAERTRLPVIENLKENIETSGGKILGTVLTERKQHIPNFIYSLFFKR